MEWGGVTSKLSEDALDKLNPPVLTAGLEIYLKAYQDLTTERCVGVSIGLIPWYSIVRWCNHYGIVEIDEIETFILYVRALEQAARKWQELREEERNKKG